MNAMKSIANNSRGTREVTGSHKFTYLAGASLYYSPKTWISTNMLTRREEEEVEKKIGWVKGETFLLFFEKESICR